MSLAEVHRNNNSQDIPTLVDCGCEAVIWNDGSGVEIEYCPLHEAAPELLKALKDVMEFYPNAIGFSDENGAYLEEDYFKAINAEEKAEQAIAKAEGGE